MVIISIFQYIYIIVELYILLLFQSFIIKSIYGIFFYGIIIYLISKKVLAH